MVPELNAIGSVRRLLIQRWLSMEKIPPRSGAVFAWRVVPVFWMRGAGRTTWGFGPKVLMTDMPVCMVHRYITGAG